MDAVALPSPLAGFQVIWTWLSSKASTDRVDAHAELRQRLERVCFQPLRAARSRDEYIRALNATADSAASLLPEVFRLVLGEVDITKAAGPGLISDQLERRPPPHLSVQARGAFHRAFERFARLHSFINLVSIDPEMLVGALKDEHEYRAWLILTLWATGVASGGLRTADEVSDEIAEDFDSGVAKLATDLGVHLYATTSGSAEHLAAQLLIDSAGLLAELDRRGVHRTPEQIALTPAERESKLTAIRRERLARGGAPVVDPERARHEALSSLRIEGVDARTWLPPRR